MSTIDLMLLGVLVQKPMNAYEVKKEMEKRNIQHWIKISSPSIYKNFIKLSKEGYIDGKVVREGEMPEKTVYSINEKGRKYFIRLMQRYSEDPGKVYLDFCAFIANLPSVDSVTGLEMIEQLQKNLAVKFDGVNDQLINDHGGSFYAAAVIELYSQMYELFCNWIEKFSKEYKEKTGASR
ncbi:putative PadR family transcriptional regulator [Oscillibacter valericigenes Sjm18-20]|nr:putative PadR family transcriptional regulator [Oscillibacter valericigenes Sjm18-20]